MPARIIVLTGATRGLGRALAGGFAAAGHTVLGCGRSATHVAELRRDLPAPHDFDVIDVADDAAVARWAERLLKQHGPPDLLVNNAGLMNTPAPLWQVPAAEFDRLLGVNIRGVVNVIRSPSLVTDLTCLVPVHTSFHEISMLCSMVAPSNLYVPA